MAAFCRDKVTVTGNKIEKMIWISKALKYSCLYEEGEVQNILKQKYKYITNLLTIQIKRYIIICVKK